MTGQERPPAPELSRWFTAILAVCLIATVLLTAGFITIGLISIANSNSIRANEIRQCQLANVSRAQDVAIWNRLLDVPPAAAAAETAAQRAEVADLERLVAVKDTLRNCTAAFSSKS